MYLLFQFCGSKMVNYTSIRIPVWLISADVFLHFLIKKREPIYYRVAQKKVYTCMLQTLTSHKSHFLLIFDGKTHMN